jgi:hypothetical protein
MRMELGRFKSFSPGSEAGSVTVENPESLKLLETAPALLMYERRTECANSEVVRYGQIRSVQVVRKELVFRFAEAGRLDRTILEEFSSRLGIDGLEHGHTHWAIKDGGIPSAMIEQLRTIGPIISSATRNAFEDSYVQNGVLRDISHDFADAGIEPQPPRQGDALVGQRRQLIQRHYASVDWHSVVGARQALAAFHEQLERLRERGLDDEVRRLIDHLKRDRARSPVLPIFDPVIRGTTVDGGTQTVEDAVSVLATSFDQAFEHLKQALEHLRSPDSARARKDGLRDCLSAMESLLKTATATKDIKDATTALRVGGRWGEDRIVKDGLTIWNHIHELYPDVRHGQATSSELSERECLYWVDRISAFVRYIARTADEVLPR